MKKVAWGVLLLLAVAAPSHAQDCIVNPFGPGCMEELIALAPPPLPAECGPPMDGPLGERCFDHLIDLVPPTISVPLAVDYPSAIDYQDSPATKNTRCCYYVDGVSVHLAPPPARVQNSQEPQPPTKHDSPGDHTIDSGVQQPQDEQKTITKYDPDWHLSLNGCYSLLYNTEPNSGMCAGMAWRFSEHFAGRMDFWTIRDPNARVACFGPEFRLPIRINSEHSSRLEPFVNGEGCMIRNDTTDWGISPITGKPFAEEQHRSSAAVSFGGGVDLRAWRYIAIRAVEINYVLGKVYRDGLSEKDFLNNMRVSTGFVLRF